MQPNEKKIWFPAKKYGWGWGPPCSWQGWVVMLLYIGLMPVGGFLLMPAHLILFITYAAVLSAVMIFICYLKGEKPRWRWGEDK